MAERLADVLAGLSRFADLGFGLAADTSLRSSVLSARLARSVGGSESEAGAAFWTALLQHVGCVGYAHESARLFGDELAVNVAIGRTDPTSSRDGLGTFLPTLTRGRPRAEQVRLAVTALARGSAWGEAFGTAACEVGRDAARRLGLSGEVQTCLLHAYDTWRGEAAAGVRVGDAIPFGARVARVTGVAALFDALGPGLAVAVVRDRAGTMLDPTLAAAFVADGAEWLSELAAGDPREAALAEEPRPVALVSDIRQAAEVFGDLADLKSPHFTGHSRRVTALAEEAARTVHLPDADVSDVAVAGLLHDVGRVAVSNRIWDKPSRLTLDEWEQVRLHPYHTERILTGTPTLARLAPLAGRHHERLDGSGYFRGDQAAELSLPARILAAADCYATISEPRPHRPALAPDRAGERLLADARNGRLDEDAVHAVLTASGQPGHTARRRPGTLSDREVEVLRLLAHGSSNSEIAEQLVISRRTAEHHVQHVYAKIGVSSRAAATLYAVEHHVLDG
ncbi:HD domain-containing phosphohydrolase [Agromyces sp. NPDC058484]|uniref:HD domain-containing phosphohydrolase n=1 Tax=Agromyces sp. NPDC058484 TaxID=3346524 RepID=UPI0036654C2D